VLRIVIKMVIPTPSHIRYFIIITPTLVRNIIPVMDITIRYDLTFALKMPINVDILLLMDMLMLEENLQWFVP
jgi:hypothetical protein